MSVDTGTPTSSVPGGLPGGAIPVATPPILPGSVPGAGAPSFGQSASVPDPSMQVNEMAKKLMAVLAQASQRKQFAGTPVPGAIPGQQDPNAARQIGMNTANPHGWGLQRFAAGLSTSIKNAVSQEKQKKLNKAEADWTYLQSALNEKYQAEASKDPKAIAAAQQKLDVVLSDPKKLKDMAKALNQDWLNPEKTTVYGDALKKVAAKTKQTEQQTQQADAQKQQAATGLKAMFQKLIQKNQQPQLTDEQKKQMGAEIEAKAPTSTTGGASVKDQAEGAKALLDLEKASKEARENYKVIIGADGKAWAYNATNPRDAFQLHDAESGDFLTGQTKAGAAPKPVAMPGGLPYGVSRGGKILTPDSPEWSADDQRLMDGAKGSVLEKQQLKIDPVYADQAGAPPDPDDYKNGRGDPKYAEALKKYGETIQALRMKDKTAARVAGVKAQLDYGIAQTMDANGNVYWDFKKNVVGQAPVSAGLTLRSKDAQMKDISIASGKARDAIKNLKPGDFSPDQVVLLNKAMSEEDAGASHALFQNLAARAVNDEQQDFIVWINQLNERAMSLRGIAGMGQGAQDLRNAIRAMLPGLASGNTKMMIKQLDAFDQQVRVLEQGIGKVGKPGTAGAPKATPAAGSSADFKPF
jgi:hypothetical protein